MAKPRVFISSTFYDLRQIREDLERAIREMEYEPVRNETGSIPYGKDDPLEEYAYREVELSDIIVAVIGGRYGTDSQNEPGYSISQKELHRALERGIQLFIFIERNVLAEYSTYQLNKENKDIKYQFVDDIRIYEFIEQVHKLPKNNPISPFETSIDIVTYLKTQWAGMFQRFLQEQKRASELQVLDEMNSVAKTLRELVTFLTEERRNSDEAIQNILQVNHPAFRRLRELTKTPYRVFFSNRNEFEAWMRTRGWRKIGSPDAPSWDLDDDSVEEWSSAKRDVYLKITNDLFAEDDRLKVFTESEWEDDWILVSDAPQEG